jgi:hypothetical protein
MNGRQERAETSQTEMKADINAKIEASQERADARQEKADADAKARHEEAEARQEKANAEMKSSKERASAEMRAVQTEIKAAYAEMEAEAKARHERMEAAIHSMCSDIDRSLHQQMGALLEGSRYFGIRTTICRVPPATCQTEVTSCPEEMDATILESTLVETEAAVERQEIFKEETNFDNIGSSENRCKDQRLAARHRRGAKKRSQDSVRSRQKVSAARKRVIRRTIPAVRKGNIRKGPSKDGSARGAPKGRTLQKTHRISPECNIGIRNRGPKDQLRLRMERTSDRIIRRTS